MHCFVCNKAINRGDEITQTLESGGMELRRVPYTGSRWVHSFCVPKNETTLYFMSVVEEMQADYPDCTIDEIMDMVENHDYWTLEEDNLPVWSIAPARPPTPPHRASNDHVDSDDSDDEYDEYVESYFDEYVESYLDEYVESYFGTLKVDPVEKAEFEKTVDETLAMLEEKDAKVEEDPDKGINELCDEIRNTLDWVKYRISNEQKLKIARSLLCE
tara:strand:+ start:2876 stop:3523 length:648 start_codon:yes stop_codon:yes gene_type:complete